MRTIGAVALRAREHNRPPSPPDRLPPRPGGRPSCKTASAAGGRGLVGFARGLAAAACLALFGALALPSTAEAQITPVCNRTAQVRDAITVATLGGLYDPAFGDGVHGCRWVNNAHLAAITSLNVSSAGITSLNEGDFDGLTALTELFLYDNSLSDLPADVFDRLTALRHLNLGDNSLSNLPADVSDGLTALTDLRLYGNSLSDLPEGVFDRLTALEILYLSRNSLSNLPADVFDRLTALTELRLDGNSLSDLPEGVFNGLTALVQLQLQNNSLSILPADVFDRLTALTRLQLQNNSLSNLPAGVFDDLTALTRLQLYGNSLSNLPAGVFDGLTSLLLLYLQGNAVDPLPVAVSLELEAPGRFRAVAPTAAPFALRLPVSVVNGEIDGGATTLTIPAGMVQSDSVSVTRSAGSTSAVTADIGTLPRLPSNHDGYALQKSSDLPLEVLAAEAGAPTPVCDRTEQVRDRIVAAVSGVSDCGGVSDAHLAAITSLQLYSAGITSLKEGDFDGLSALTGLGFDTNSLSELPEGVFDGLTALTYLDLDNNSLSNLPAGVFDDLTALKTLQVRANRLSGLPEGVFDGLTALTYLELSSNSLNDLPAGVFDGLTSLEDLHLDYNSLSDLPEGVFDGLSALTELRLHNNSLSNLPEGVFDGLTSLETLRLYGNPVDPLPVAVSLEPAGPGRFRAVAPTAAPFALTLPVSVFNGEIDGGATTLTIPAGMVQSDSVTVTRSAGSTSAVTADIGTLPGLPSGHQGYALQKSSGLPLEVFAAEPGAPTPVCERTVQVRDGIVAAVSGVSDCANVTDAHLAAITSLNLVSKGITSLQEGDFDGLTALTTELILGNNSLSELPAGVFDDLSALTKLFLYGNSLSNLPEGVFDDLSALTHLFLYDNSLSSLPAGVFDGLTALTSLDLHSNSLSNLPEGVFDGLSALEQLNLGGNSLSSLPEGVFDGLSALTDLSLGGNPVDPLPVAVSLEPAGPGRFRAVAPTAAPFALTLPVSVFNGEIDGGATTLTIPAGMVHSDSVTVTRSAGSTSAVTADIGTLPGLPSGHRGYALQKSSGLPLEVFAAELGAPTPVCDRTEQVRDGIVAAVSGVSTCGGVTDAHLAAITRLGLGSAGITSLKEGDFDGLTALTYLALGRNSLSNLPAGVFDDLSALTELYLGYNSLSNLPADVFDGLSALTILGLESNSLSELPEGVFDDLTALTGLHLWGNSLISLPEGVFDGLSALTELSLYDNSLSNLPEGVFDDLTALKLLLLSINSLISLPEGVFDGLTALTTLRLNDNSLSELPAGVFSGLTSLRLLYLDGNPVDPLPVAVSLEPEGPGRFRAVAPTAAPFALSLPVSVFNGEIDGGATTLTIPVGMVHSASVSVTRFGGSAVTADIGTLPGLPSGHFGYALQKSSGLPLEVFAAEPGAPTPVCDRTVQVRDRIVAQVSGVSACANVTDAHLAAITEMTSFGFSGLGALAVGDFTGLTALTTLRLEYSGLTLLPAGVFDDLTSLTSLNLDTNGLTELPAGVFDGLTSLQFLILDQNGLTELPAGVFDDLTSLVELHLEHNELTTLPDDVFEPLGYAFVDLSGNPGAPFSAEAVALPDDGTVSSAGGTVTLDGSSGGAWGTSVFYSWALTSPASGVTVTFDDNTSATRVVTIPALTDGTELTFTLTVTVAFTSVHEGTAAATDTATVTVTFDPTLGICGRTEAVRDAIVGQISGVTHCALVTDAHLAAITGTLRLERDGITALAAGDFAGLTALDVLRLGNNELSTLDAGVFDGLTALRDLYLDNNGLTSLDAGVFAGLTALTKLYLNSNELSTLDAGVFAGLTALEYLELPDNGLATLDAGVFAGLTLLISLVLSDNELATLPDDVFEPLIRLLRLNLSNNSGEPFAPTADALPDDGTVSNAGGTVTLDGSGSDGGPWGTNVVYRWALTDPASGVTVMFDDTAIATPEVTIPALTPVTELTFTLTVTGRGGTDGIDPATDTATVRVGAASTT